MCTGWRRRSRRGRNLGHGVLLLGLWRARQVADGSAEVVDTVAPIGDLATLPTEGRLAVRLPERNAAVRHGELDVLALHTQPALVI
ncbi:hypothetical protein Agsp01_02940 [Agromyces sp. NBRC 114283]|nr:hypothetical protein Agsp01_02940 [Agromyces sp. NBRC 114283]